MRFVLTLHSHLPWVLHHGRWPHGSDWLSEATLDTYLPLIAMLDKAKAAGVDTPITLGITPILAAQLSHPSFRHEVNEYFRHRFETLNETPESLQQTGDEELVPLVQFWREHLTMLSAVWQSLDGDVLGAFRRHANSGRIELISSAATHGFLPLLARDESVTLQLLVGRAEHLKHFGELPRGCWLPECAYRPAGQWNPWPGAPAVAYRTGIEEHLRAAGFGWFVVDAHLVGAGEAWEMYEGKATHHRLNETRRSPYRSYEVGDRPSKHARPIKVLVRDPEATAQVWSRHGGYPGDSRYLEFHKIRHPGGLKFWRVTDPAADLGQKEAYQPEDARQAATQHAMHFRSVLNRLMTQAEQQDDTITAPFDTELFGHWWFEGIDWLGELFAGLDGIDVVPTTGGKHLDDSPPKASVRMLEGSWGANGDFSKWLNPETAWTWEMLWRLEHRFWNAVPEALIHRVLAPVIEQAARELLLAQSSDWQFIISTGAAGDYATERFVGHCNALESLLPILEGGSGDLNGALSASNALKEIDGPFSDILGAISAASDVRESVAT